MTTQGTLAAAGPAQIGGEPGCVLGVRGSRAGKPLPNFWILELALLVVMASKLRDEVADEVAEVTFTARDEAVQTLSTHRSDPSFRERARLRRPHRQSPDRTAALPKSLVEPWSIDRGEGDAPDHGARRRPLSNRFPDHAATSDPGRTRTCDLCVRSAML